MHRGFKSVKIRANSLTDLKKTLTLLNVLLSPYTPTKSRSVAVFHLGTNQWVVNFHWPLLVVSKPDNTALVSLTHLYGQHSRLLSGPSW